MSESNVVDRGSKVRILAYHEVKDPENFRKQLNYISKRWHVISISELEECLYSTNAVLPEKAVMITFDDGDYTVYKNGFPVLKDLGLSFTLFVITDLLNSEKSFWWDIVLKYSKGNRETLRRMKSIQNHARREEIKVFEAKLSPEELVYRQLKVEELLEMIESGATIANHTHTHPILNNCSHSEIIEEFRKSKEVFERYNFNGYKYFAFPNGNQFSNQTTILSQFDFKLAFLFNHQIAYSSENPLQLSRLSVNSTTSLAKLKFILSGLHSQYLNLKKEVF